MIRCPFCRSSNLQTTDTRSPLTSESIRRRRQCANGHRFSTEESVVPTTAGRAQLAADHVGALLGRVEEVLG